MIEHLIRLSIPLEPILEKSKQQLTGGISTHTYELLNVEVQKTAFSEDRFLVLLFRQDAKKAT